MQLAQPTLMIDNEKKLRQFSRVVLAGDAGDNLIRYPSTILALKEAGICSVLTNMIKLQQLYNKRPPLGIGLRTKLKKWISNDTSRIQAAYPYPTYIYHDFEKKLDLSAEWNESWKSLQNKQSLHTRQATLEWSLFDTDWDADDLLMESDFTLPEKRDPYLDLRMVELVLSLPALPWLFNKHILRRSMQGLLPDKVRYRPKAPLGYLNHALTKRDENGWIKLWKPNIKSSLYLKKGFLFQQSNNPLISYLDSRPIILDAWIKENSID